MRHRLARAAVSECIVCRLQPHGLQFSVDPCGAEPTRVPDGLFLSRLRFRDDAVCAARQDRPVDVVFVGGYTRRHKRRSAVLEAVAGMADEYNIVFHLDRSRLCRLAESPIGWFLPLAKHRRPAVGAGDRNRPDLRPRLLRCASVGQDRAQRLDRHAERGSRQHALFRGAWGADRCCFPIRETIRKG